MIVLAVVLLGLAGAGQLYRAVITQAFVFQPGGAGKRLLHFALATAFFAAAWAVATQ